MQNKTLGDLGEQLAAEYLQNNGFAVLERKYRSNTGEIDIIAQDAQYLVFIEVKTRRSFSYGTPAQAVTWTKQAKIIKTAQAYLYRQRLYNTACRFDVIEVYYSGSEQIIFNHIKNAFME